MQTFFIMEQKISLVIDINYRLCNPSDQTSESHFASANWYKKKNLRMSTCGNVLKFSCQWQFALSLLLNS